MPGLKRIHFALLLFSIFILLTIILLFLRFRHFYHDDEMISLRYISNWLQHGELDWNLGEKVEGYTNFLHMMFTAFFIKITHDYLLGPRIVNIIFYGLFIFSASFLYLKKSDSKVTDRLLKLLIFLAIAGTYPGMIIWIYGGLETVMYTTLIFMAISSIVYFSYGNWNAVLSALLFTMAAMTRPDGVLFLVLSVIYLFYKGYRVKNIRPAIIFTSVFALLFGAYFFLRYHYYGQILPNTFYAKTGFDLEKLGTGLIYVVRFAGSLLFVIAGLVWLMYHNIRRKNLDHKIAFLYCAIILYSSYIALYGGDHMLGFRFLVPIVPLIGLLITELISLVPFKLRFGVISLLFANVIFSRVYNQKEFRNAVVTDAAAFNGAIVGEYLARTYPDSFVIATNSAGAVPFFAIRHHFIDMLGLCDTTIAHRSGIKKVAPWQKIPGHEKGDGNYVFGRHPDIIIIGPSQGSGDKPWFLSDVELLQNPNFKKEYKELTVQLPYDSLDVNSTVEFIQGGGSDSLTFTYFINRRDL